MTGRSKLDNGHSGQGSRRDVPRGDDEMLPRYRCGFAQRRLWFLSQLDQQPATYNVPALLRCQGPFDVDALRQALGALTDRHQVLRSHLEEIDGEPYQVVAPKVSVEPELVDLADCHDSEKRSRAAIREAAERPFSLSDGPLMRVLLCRMGPLAHDLLLCFHHAAVDGASLAVLLRELGELYEAFRDGGSNPLASLSRQYVDFAAWERGFWPDHIAAELEFWRGSVAGVPRLEFPGRRLRHRDRLGVGDVCPMEVPRSLTRKLERIASDNGTTLFTLLLAAFHVLLSRQAGQRDFAIGVPAANRSLREAESMVGPLAETIALRIERGGDPPFDSFLRRLAADAMAALDRGAVLPFDLLVEATCSSRSLDTHPLFQTFFAYQGECLSAASFTSLQVDVYPIHTGTAKFDLMLDLRRTVDGALTGVLEHDLAVFDPPEIEDFGRRFLAFLQSVVDAPDSTISTLETAADRDLVIVPGVEADRTAAPSISDRIGEQIERHPDRPAIVHEAGTWTYERLGREVSCTARFLTEHGVKRGDVVAVSMCRTPDLVAVLLAIWKVGAAYLPLDRQLPESRVAAMLADSGAALLVTDARAAYGADAFPITRVMVEEGGPAPEPAGPRDEYSAPGDTDLAYVIYTSGSTGQPKGVAVEHRNLSNLVAWAERFYATSDWQLYLATTSLAFDVSVFELFAPLSMGGTVLLAEDLLSVPALPKDLAPTTISGIPAGVAELLEHDNLATSLRTVNLAGEPLQADLVGRLLSQSGIQRVIDLYGPTEATVYATAGDRDPAGPDNIGRPLDGGNIYILDESLRPTPVGVVGEICIGGAGVARGYLARPGLTAACFIPDPFCGRPGARMYRTGDRGRRLADGTYQFAGRVDSQIKLRGHRIELGEIESVLRQHPGVREVVIDLLRDEKVGPSLIAYVEPNGDCPLQDTLQAACAACLPPIMVPDSFVIMPRLPRTTSGKVDRKALPREVPRRPGVRNPVAPESPLETTVLSVFREVLGDSSMGVTSDFFERGGHSLLAMRVVARLRGLLDTEIPLKDMFTTPSARGLAARIDDLWMSSPVPRRAPARQRPRQVPLSVAQERIWLACQDNPLAYHISGAIWLEGEFAAERLQRAVDRITDRHEALRTTFVIHEGRPIQSILDRMTVTVEQPDLASQTTAVSEAEVRRQCRSFARRPFDLAKGPLFRCATWSVNAQRHVVAVVLHHLVADAWSLEMLMDELSLFYNCPDDRTPAGLPELQLQYPDWAIRDRERRSADDESATRRDDTADFSPVRLPVDRTGHEGDSVLGWTHCFSLKPGLIAPLRRLVESEAATLFMGLLCAWLVTLHRYSGQKKPAIGVPFVRRTDSDMAGVIGLCVETIPLGLDLSDCPSFRDALRRVREAMVDAIADAQTPPVEPAGDSLGGEKVDAVTRALFAYRDRPLGCAPLGGAHVSRVEVIETGAARADLTLFAETDEDGASCALEFRANLFHPDTVERLADNLKAVLAEAIGAPDVTLRSLRAGVSAPQVSTGPRSVPATDEEPLALQELFARQARRTPNDTAVITDSRSYSYAELKQRSDNVAGRLMAAGVGPEEVVGVCMERGVGLVAAIIGTMQAGAAWLPIDPSYPERRRKDLCRLAGLRRAFVDAGTGDKLSGEDIRLIDLDRPWPDDSARAFPHRPGPRGLAYVIPTSGSTGRPKLVAIEHRSVVNLLQWSWRNFSKRELTTVFAGTSICFDLAVFELFAPLTCGGSVVVGRNPLDIVNHPAAGNVTLLNTVPSAMAELLRRGGVPDRVRTVNLAGEPLGRQLVDDIYRQSRVERVLDLYGPAETTTYSTWTRRRVSELENIGVPIANTSVSVRDVNLGLLPTGGTGELFIGGTGLARGYLHEPGQTAARFLPDPDGPPGSRMYRTGDVARQRGDGRFELLGRIDHQVKVSGIRIELGEVESALRSHPAVADAAVVTVGKTAERRRLHGFATLVGDAENPEDLRDWVRRRLPRFMTPASVRILPALPRLPNGKLDRGALEAMPAAGSDAPAPPTSELEQVLVRIWCGILDIATIGVDDDFFALGGNSLSALRLTTEVGQRYAVDIGVRDVLENPTIRQFAGAIESCRRRRLPPWKPAPPDGYTGLTAAQRLLWPLYRMAPESPNYHVPIALRLQGALDADCLQQAINGVIADHAALRTRFEFDDGEPVQIVETECKATIEHERLSGSDISAGPAAAMRRAHDIALGPLRLDRAPVMRAALLQLGETDHVLVLVFHHLLVDAWSLSIVVRDLELHYRRALDGESQSRFRPDERRDKVATMAEFAQWERACLASPAAPDSLGFWRRALDGAESRVFPSSPARARSAATPDCVMKSRTLPRSLIAQLDILSREVDGTLFHVLLATFALSLSARSGRRDLLIGVPHANRPVSPLNEAVGFFTNTLPLRFRIGRDHTFRDFLQAARDHEVTAAAHGWVPLEEILNQAPQLRSPDRLELFEAAFIHQNLDRFGVDFAGLTGEYLPPDPLAAKFDVMMTVLQRPERLTLHLETRSSLYSARETAVFLDEFVDLLERAAAQPQMPVEALLSTRSGPTGEDMWRSSLRLPRNRPGEGEISVPVTALRDGLLAQSGIEDCHVEVRRDTSAELRFVAYVEPSTRIDQEETRRRIAEHLGVASLPLSLCCLDSLPRTGTGAIDVARLATLPVLDTKFMSSAAARLRQQWPEHRCALAIDIEIESGDASAEAAPDADTIDAVPDSDPTPGKAPTAYVDGGSFEPPRRICDSLGDALRRTADAFPQKGLRLVSESGERCVAYSKLYSDALHLMAGLAEVGVRTGDAVVLQIRPYDVHFTAFWACLLGGFRPLNCAVIVRDDAEDHRAVKLRDACETLADPWVLADHATSDLVSAVLGDGPPIRGLLDVHSVIGHSSSQPPTAPGPDDIAFYQLSSGSTGRSKVIAETHASVLQHIEASSAYNDYKPSDISLNWLPLDHVVPILTFHLKDAVLGCDQIHVETALVLHEPLRWLDLMERHRVTHTWSPNFGFRLVGDALADYSGGGWDLSALRRCMNAGEQVTLPVVKEFLRRTADFGVDSQVMQPAFGMAELSTCITYLNDFDIENSVHHVKRDSLNARLEFADRGASSTLDLVELGAPITGVELRIVDNHNNLLPERHIGRLQARGGVVTPGYHRNDSANGAAFVGDGWFDSGDLGFLVDGRLVLSGRASETIVVRGVNYACQEFEEVAGRVPGVRAGLVAAASIPAPDSGTEAVALFFVADGKSGADLPNLARQIAGRVADTTGISPDILVPLAADEFPRTTSGKIQRSKLRDRLEAGHFRDRILGPARENPGAGSPPMNFHAPVWHPVELAPTADAPPAGRLMVFSTESILADQLTHHFEELGVETVMVVPGESFAALGTARYSIRPGSPEDYAALIDKVNTDEHGVTHVLHLWTCRPAEPPRSVATLRAAQAIGLDSLLAFVQAWGDRPATMCFVSRGTQASDSDEVDSCAHAPLLGMLRTVSQERPHLRCRHIDLDRLARSTDAARIARELLSTSKEPEILWRGEVRYARRFRTLPRGEDRSMTQPGIRDHATCIITGGLGSVGMELARHLLRNHAARICILGRSSPDQDDCQRKLASLHRIAGRDGRISYRRADVTDSVAFCVAVESAEAEWETSTDYIFHLAATWEEVTERELRNSNAWRSLSAKVEGAIVAGRLLEDRPKTALVLFSSVTASFGGALTGSYAAANRFLESYARYLRAAHGFRVFTFSWTAWDAGARALLSTASGTRAAGFDVLLPRAALRLLDEALRAGYRECYLGLIERHPRIRRLIVGPTRPSRLLISIEAGPDALPSPRTWSDRFGTPIQSHVRPVARIRHGQFGEWSQADAIRERPIDMVGGPPRSDFERAIASEWSDLLQLPSIGREQNFFEAGGNSMLLAQLQVRLTKLFGVSSSMIDLFRHPTVAAMASRFEGDETVPAANSRAAARTAELAAARQERRGRRLDHRKQH